MNCVFLIIFNSYYSVPLPFPIILFLSCLVPSHFHVFMCAHVHMLVCAYVCAFTHIRVSVCEYVPVNFTGVPYRRLRDMLITEARASHQ